jgi:DmsE family decaheme c-type cytochrome
VRARAHTPAAAAAIVALTGMLWLATLGPVEALAEPLGSQPPAGYSKRGADTCLKCHDEDYDYPVVAIFYTKHARQDDPRTPFAGLQCEACHGPAKAHTEKVMPGESRPPPPFTFGDKAKIPPKQQNSVCLGCHESGARLHWKGSTHEVRQLACANCHRIHAPKDPILSKASQPDVCFRCHRKQRADINKASVHPVRFGLVVCTDCHNVHGGPAERLLKRPTLNETCYGCHAEKRGPFLWEHAPVAENCTYCHLPHGSDHPALLKKVPPLLCQQCHSQIGHPSVAYSGTGIPPLGTQAAMLAEGCLNCHSQVHGSNHPSGVKRMR